jgi:hypothetical protein
MNQQNWISAAAFAEAAGISEQSARAVLRASHEGTSWRGQRLTVRRRFGRGGRGGLSHQVDVRSLPADLQSRLAADFAPPPSPQLETTAPDGAIEKLAALETMLQRRPATPDRGLAADQAAIDQQVSRRTIYRWLARYEAHGVRGLARSRPANRGTRRVLVSREFDRAFRGAGLAEETLQEIAKGVDQSLKGLWASRAEQAGGTEVRRLAEFMLAEACERKGIVLPTSVLRLSRRRVEQFAPYRVVNQRRNDRKAFDDARPRIRRDWTGLAPMERVVADVKHLDVIVRRSDGTPAWPKIIAFMDAGTGRVFVHPVLLERGEGVRQEHVIEAFLAMVSQAEWGFPQGLYLDNGAEFGALVKIDGALQQLNQAGARTLIFARPYNASAKPIESLFARLDRYVFALLPGYAGPHRLAKKTQTVGKPPQPYPGTWEAFCATLKELISAHNLRPVGGPWAGRSPQDWLHDKIAAGWRPATIDPRALDAAFAEPDSRRVDRGVLKIGGLRYTHPRLAALPARTIVDLALPWRRAAEPLARIEGDWVYLEREVAYPARWVEGARESGRRQTAQNQHVKALAREAPRVDPVATKIRWAKRVASEQTPLATIATDRLDLGSEVRERARAIAPPPTDVAQAPTPAELRRAREMALTERLEREQRGDD